MTATCPTCSAPQDAGLMCHNCTTRLERDLGDVASIVADLDITLSKQARIGNTSGPSGLARERTPINVGAMEAGDNLANVLTTWARDVSGGQWRPKQDEVFVVRAATQPYIGPFHDRCEHPTCQRMRLTLVDHAPPLMQQVSLYLLGAIDAIRRHPAVNEMVDEISDAISQARRVVDRPADRIYLGQCLMEDNDVTCYEELYASPSASEVRCKVCGVTHPVGERRAWLLQRAEDMLFTAAKASEVLGEIGHITVTQASIRGYIHRGKIAYRAPIAAKRFRLGDLLAVIMDEQERKTA